MAGGETEEGTKKRATNKDLSRRTCCNWQNSAQDLEEEVSRGPSIAGTGRRDKVPEADQSGCRDTARQARLLPSGEEKSLWLLPAESHHPRALSCQTELQAIPFALRKAREDGSATGEPGCSSPQDRKNWPLN